MKRTTWMWTQIAIAWGAFVLYAGNTHAEALVRDFASLDSTTSIWRAPKDAQFVRRLRGSDVAIVPVAEMLPTDRVMSCDDPAVLPGSTATCTTVQPDTKNNWRLWAVLLPVVVPPPPPAPKVTDIKVSWTYKPDAASTPLAELTGYRISLKLQGCNPTVPLCEAEGYGDPIVLGTVNAYETSVPGEMHEVCVTIQGLAETTEGPYTEACSERESVPGAVEVAVEFTTR